MFKRFITFAAFVTPFALSLVSPAFAAPQNFVTSTSLTNSTRAMSRAVSVGDLAQVQLGVWSPQQLTSGDRGTSTTPALASYGGRLYMVWKGVGDDSAIYYSSFDGSSWSPQQLTSGDRGTSAAPALASYGGRLYMVWKGVGDDSAIYYSSFDGSSWSPQQLTSGDRGTSAAPALASYGGRLYMVWKGVGDDSAIYYSSFDGSSWS
ncbi:hypothetical protein, partial [Nostoc sp.]|uniref:hypothetical protein n=1 Tax=Nostoc sp. TaxID=1180 RepID=UPI002FFCA56A